MCIGRQSANRGHWLTTAVILRCCSFAESVLIPKITEMWLQWERATQPDAFLHKACEKIYSEYALAINASSPPVTLSCLSNCPGFTVHQQQRHSQRKPKVKKKTRNKKQRRGMQKPKCLLLRNNRKINNVLCTT